MSFRLRPDIEDLPRVESTGSRKLRLAVSAHLHFQDQVDHMIDLLESFHGYGDFFLTCTSQEVYGETHRKVQERGLEVELRLCQNVGRNFGPLLVEFGPSLAEYELLVHLHTKRSNHARRGYGEEWAAELEAPFCMPTLLETMQILNESPQVGAVYGYVSHRVKAINYYWGANAEPVQVALGVEIKDGPLPLMYPAGGMFAVKTIAIKALLEKKWTYSDFPPEENQIDGTLQHGIERLIGQTVTQAGMTHVVYSSTKKAFGLWRGWSYK